MKPLHRQFVRTARGIPLRFAMADAQNTKVTFGAALVKTIFLARRLKKIWSGQEMVGIFLPPSVPGALVNYAALLCGKVPVNLNYTLSEADARLVRASNANSRPSSRRGVFLEKVKLTLPGETIYLEDVAGPAGTFGTRLLAFLLAAVLPVSWLERALGNCRRQRQAASEFAGGRKERAFRCWPQPGKNGSLWTIWPP